MKLPIFQVDAFAEKLFQGNPAAVIPLKEWLSDALMQSIALENNLSETAFFVSTKAGFEIRWFTPKAEVDLCGHATLATAHVIFNEASYPQDTLTFSSRSGKLTVTKSANMLQLNFPADTIQPIDEPRELIRALGKAPKACFLGKSDYLFVYDSQHELEQMQPDFGTLKHTGVRGIIVTAPGNTSDFVSRFFAPGLGIDEDPVTGSAHTTLMPYWTDRLQKQELSARQISSRGGLLQCALQGDRVLIAGKARTFLRGEIFIDS
ncbi:PhzF family phenazine biosynthesis protein [uncultured Sunxiuqinia sp.]|uniref:PhzF family phenazine biosynthesis protein n=1 Tax=uncultured Sunxiuqinia sp. TaxID=1573825 RepID=UPI00262BE077|nr:PhzF family phenazine biosynthesis protein [uncultured Sunxiuqinia sp.]